MNERFKPLPISLLGKIKIPEVDMSGYVSPIDLIYKDCAANFDKQLEDGIMRAVTEVGIVVDKDRLIWAIEGDRASYSDGYRRGYEVGFREAIDRLKLFLEGYDVKEYNDDGE